MAFSKIILNNVTQMDVTDTTAEAYDVAEGKYFYGADGIKKTGVATGNAFFVTETQDEHGGTITDITSVDISDSTITADKILNGYVGYSSTGQRLVGTAAGGSITQDVNGALVFSEEGITGLSLEDVLNKRVSGDIVLNITNQPTPTNNPDGSKYYDAWFNGLFGDMTEVTSITVNGLKWIPRQFARANTGITSISFPDAIFAGARLCNGATSLVTANLPSLEHSYSNYQDLSQYMFSGCTNLSNVNVGNIDRVGQYMFNNCTSLTVLDFNAINYIYANAFAKASNLTTIIIRSTSIPTLANVSAFTNTPFASGGTGGTIYIPKSLYDHLGDESADDYKAATNWSTLDGYGTVTWAQIENSQYDNS